MKILRRIIITCVVMMVGAVGHSQAPTDYQIARQTENAKALMEAGEFNSAYTQFRQILNSGKVLPTNLSYYFAETLYHIGQYQNSENFLDKYLKITGKGGDLYFEAVELSKLLDKEFSKISNCQLCDVSGYRLVQCTHCQGQKNLLEPCHICQGRGITSCKKCEGEGVVIYTDVFGDNKYQTCDKCDGEGYHSCETCSGQKSILLSCPVCIGSGFEKSKQLCDHREDHNN